MGKRELDYREYPAADGFRSGCKVGWRYYRKEKHAKACAEVAKHNAMIQEGLGFDFGYQVPGTIRKMTKEEWDGKYAGLFEVCVP